MLDLATCKKYFWSMAFIGVIYVCHSVMAMCKNDNWAPRANLILDEVGRPRPCLLKLLAEFGIEHDGTLDDIVNKTQASWLRKPGQERWDLASEKTAKLAQNQGLFRACGCMDEVAPALMQYDYAIVMGALTARMRMRLAYAVELWKNGVRFKQLILLSGRRPRMPQLETENMILGIGLVKNPLTKKPDWQFSGPLPENEADIMRVLFEQADLPADFLANVQVVFVEAPMKLNADGQLVRPTTADTVDEWLQQHPVPGTCLLVTNNPYVGYQDSVARTLLPASFKIEAVGQIDTGDSNLAVHLDNLARWLHQERQRRSKAK